MSHSVFFAPGIFFLSIYLTPTTLKGCWRLGPAVFRTTTEREGCSSGMGQPLFPPKAWACTAAHKPESNGQAGPGLSWVCPLTDLGPAEPLVRWRVSNSSWQQHWVQYRPWAFELTPGIRAYLHDCTLTSCHLPYFSNWVPTLTSGLDFFILQDQEAWCCLLGVPVRLETQLWTLPPGFLP